jgi:hypothetical protein
MGWIPSWIQQMLQQQIIANNTADSGYGLHISRSIYPSFGDPPPAPKMLLANSSEKHSLSYGMRELK